MTTRWTRLAALFALAASLSLPAARAQAPLVRAESPTPVDRGSFGGTVLGVPDLDGDGRGDVVVGAVAEDAGETGAGQVHVFSGATGALLRSLKSPAPQFNGQFGASLALVPDTDGDGRGDLLVGALAENGNGQQFRTGRVYLFRGTTDMVRLVLASPNPQFGRTFGFAVAGVPDADGDGVADLLVSAPFEDGGAPNAGRAYLFSGATGALLRSLVSPAPEASGYFGFGVSGVPDVDGDGRGDLLVLATRDDGVPGEDGGAGRIYLFSGATGALLRTIGSPDPDAAGSFGFSAVGVRDADGDGRGDLLAAAFTTGRGGADNAGHVSLYSGATGAVLMTLTSPNPEVGGFFGSSIASVPDTDGDGRDEILVGASAEAAGYGGPLNTGRAYLFSGMTGALLRSLASPAPDPGDFYAGYFGAAVASVPDVDGNGRADLLVGAFFENGGAQDAGRVYVFAAAATTAAPAPDARRLALSARPNPTAAAATLAFTLDAAGPARIVVVDALGREVAVAFDGAAQAGETTARVDVSALPAGVYVARLTAGASVATQRVTVVR